MAIDGEEFDDDLDEGIGGGSQGAAAPALNYDPALTANLSGTQKAAILLIALGPEKSSAIFKHLKEDEIEELTLEIANTRSVTPQVKDAIIEEFYGICLAQQYIAEGGINYAKELLEKALGEDKAMDVISKLTASLQVKPFEFIRKADPSQLLTFIQDEHPQTIALVMSYMSPAQSALILGALPPERQADVAKRIATMDRTSPDTIKDVERVLETKLSALVNQDYTVVGGVDAVVEILNTVDRATEKHIMETLEIEQPELADEIRKKMFVFEDILLLDDRAIQRVLRDVDNADLGLACKGSTEAVQTAIFNNLSKRLAAMIKEDMDFMGPVRMKDVEEAQQKIVNIIRKLEDSGEIVISRGGGDDLVV
ncbi:flagellar motor switch protein FliG [Butyrivibrio sp. WCD3002]|uniref:flagellar motor switch protein FliG n=1 Tax=Butyrivibrio sp. WCD3002 TaxID=1280676 RepID=UPI0004136D67|nr:flagellar motor switch protein FliG [Butyrivibrio sp. WCD3002]